MAIMASYVWLVLDEKTEEVLYSTPITLMTNGDGGGGDIKFNGRVNGKWQYAYDPENDKGVMTLEFVGGRGRWRRHCMVQVSEQGDFVLVPKGHDVYDAPGLWQSKHSVPHENSKMVVMQRVVIDIGNMRNHISL